MSGQNLRESGMVMPSGLRYSERELWNAHPEARDALRRLSRCRESSGRYKAALEECCRLSGADLSDGFPTLPELPEFAVECVQTLRIDADDTADLDRADQYATALQQIARRTTDVPVGAPCYPLASDVCQIAREALEGPFLQNVTAPSKNGLEGARSATPRPGLGGRHD